MSNALKEMGADEAVKAIAAAESMEDLVALRAEELASGKKARSSVLKAISERRVELFDQVELEERVWSGKPLYGCSEDGCEFESFDRDDTVQHMVRVHGFKV